MTIQLGHNALSAVDCLFGVSIDEVIRICDNAIADTETCRSIAFWLDMACKAMRKGYHNTAHEDLGCAYRNIEAIFNEDTRIRARELYRATAYNLR